MINPLFDDSREPQTLELMWGAKNALQHFILLVPIATGEQLDVMEHAARLVYSTQVAEHVEHVAQYAPAFDRDGGADNPI